MMNLSSLNSNAFPSSVSPTSHLAQRQGAIITEESLALINNLKKELPDTLNLLANKIDDQLEHLTQGGKLELSSTTTDLFTLQVTVGELPPPQNFMECFCQLLTYEAGERLIFTLTPNIEESECLKPVQVDVKYHVAHLGDGLAWITARQAQETAKYLKYLKKMSK